MLKLNDEEFACGVATYYEDDPSGHSRQTSINVRFSLPNFESIFFFAKIDPATPWVVLNSDINELLGLRAESTDTTLQTALGNMRGCLERYPITLIAEHGKALQIDATLFVCNEWTRGNFLGYSGFLERIRFAVDPHCQKFYFGRISQNAN